MNHRPAGIPVPIAILKPLWSMRSDGNWQITDLKGLNLKPRSGFESDYFLFESDMELMSRAPKGNVHQAFTSFGTTDFLMKQSILPVVAWNDGDHLIRCIGTASVVSCSGYVLTAAHVLLDPYDRGYGATYSNGQFRIPDDLNFGVFMPASPAYGQRGLRFFPFEKLWLWGSWRESPLFNERDSFEFLTDIAVCKIPQMPYGVAHQPLSMSVNPFCTDETAYSLGYAEMEDIPLKYGDAGMIIADFKMDLYVSVGQVIRVYEQNHSKRDVTTPGPCFEFRAKIPGKMSGAPIFGAHGAIIRGVVSRSFSGEPHASGAMIGPAMDLPMNEPQTDGQTLRELMEKGNEGIAQVQGMGL